MAQKKKKIKIILILVLVILSVAVFLLLTHMPFHFGGNTYLSGIDFRSISAIKSKVTSLTKPELLSDIILNPFRGRK